MASSTTPGTSRELQALVDGGWRRFRGAVRHVGRAKMEGQTGAGGTFHALGAHVAGWHDLTARRLRMYRTTGKFASAGDEAALGIPAFKDTDDFNARLVKSHRLVGAEALTDELDTTFRALRSEGAQLTDAQNHPNHGLGIKVVAGNSYGHHD